MIFDYAIGRLTAPAFPIYGHLVPRNEWGVWLILLALIPALAACLGGGRLSEARRHAWVVAAGLTAYAGAYAASCRWLDDLFVNLAHPYNLLHHGRFSVSPGSMVNGTVEIAYYLLLTPLAGSRASLIVADYGLGLAVGGLHVALAAALLRRVPTFPRLAALLAVALAVPLVQTFSGGYGNGLVSLAVFYGASCLIHGRHPRRVAAMSALLPLLRPDALIYSAALLTAEALLSRRLRPALWLPTLATAPAYFALVRVLYGDWTPVPMALKAVSPGDLWHAAPGLPAALAAYFLGSDIHLAQTGLAAAFFLLPDAAPPGGVPLTKRAAGIWLAVMFPALLFFRAAATVGHNPTVTRYFVGFELALTVVAACGLARLIGFFSERAGRAGAVPPRRLRLAQAAAAILALAGSAWAVGDGLRRTDGRSLGIELDSAAFRYIETNTFAGRYCASVLPAGWRVAATEMDTFGFMSGREILDLWGFSNRDIARSPRRSPSGVRSNPGVFLASGVPVFWLRTVPETVPRPEKPDATLDISAAPRDLPGALARFPNLCPDLNQAGDLMAVFGRYDVVRVHHAPKGAMTVLLVRKDLTPRLCASLARSGHVLRGAAPFDMAALRRACRETAASRADGPTGGCREAGYQRRAEIRYVGLR